MVIARWVRTNAFNLDAVVTKRVYHERNVLCGVHVGGSGNVCQAGMVERNVSLGTRKASGDVQHICGWHVIHAGCNEDAYLC